MEATHFPRGACWRGYTPASHMPEAISSPAARESRISFAPLYPISNALSATTAPMERMIKLGRLNCTMRANRAPNSGRPNDGRRTAGGGTQTGQPVEKVGGGGGMLVDTVIYYEISAKIQIFSQVRRSDL